MLIHTVEKSRPTKIGSMGLIVLLGINILVQPMLRCQIVFGIYHHQFVDLDAEESFVRHKEEAVEDQFLEHRCFEPGK